MDRSRLLTTAFGLGFPITIAAILTFYFRLPYIITLLIILSWSAFGQLITLDDELPGGWANSDGDPAITRHAITWLASTVVIIGALIWFVRVYPFVQDYRW